MGMAGSVRDELANEQTLDQAERLRADLASVGSPATQGDDQSISLEEIIETGSIDTPWVTPGLLRRDWRAVIVASEGSGKSTLLRQIATCAAQGVHPLKFHRCEPIRVLVIDAENPRGAVAETGGRILEQVRRTVGADYDSARLRFLMRPGGLDLRARHDRSQVERELVNHRPDLVVAGPAYKLASRHDRESFEDLADATHRILDDLRTRHSFALVVEHHAPHGTAGVRDMRPYGGSQWLRWPELGIGLKPNDDRSGLLLDRWRGDRLRNEWPDEIRRDRVWPWIGHWYRSDGAF